MIECREGCFVVTEIRNDFPVVQTTSYRQNHEVPKTSKSNDAIQEVNATEIETVSAVNNTAKLREEYSDAKTKRILEGDLDKLINRMFPDFGVKFKIHDSGNIIINIIDRKTEDIVREIPSEKNFGYNLQYDSKNWCDYE